MHRYITLPIAAVLAALALIPAAGATRHKIVLTAIVGPDENITLTTAAGSPVKTLRPGFYAIRVSDRSSNHNFHLLGPGLSMACIGGTGTTVWTMSLKKGVYSFVCDPHANFMKGGFTVS